MEEVMSYNAREILTRFVTYAGLPHGMDGRRMRFPDGSGSSLYYETDSAGRVVQVNSYGFHFPLARLILTHSGKRKRWLLNGDRWGRGGFGRTDEHNDIMRELAQASGTPWFIIPFSAMREARIEPDTITPVHVEPERWTTEEHTATVLEDVPEYQRMRWVWVTADDQVIIPPSGGERNYTAEPDRKGGWYVTTRSALEGWQRIPVDGPSYEGELRRESREITPVNGLYRWTTERHWLGSSLFRARYHASGYVMRKGERVWEYGNPQALFVTSFDYNEPRPLWFMSQLPRGAKASTVTEAIDALKPDQVRRAGESGMAVLRQGDVFAIPVTLTNRDIRMAGARIQPARNSARYVLGTNHAATDAYITPCGDTYAQGYLRHKPQDGRRPDHVTIQLGDRKTWFLLVKNTVPEGRSWSLGGNVD